MRTLLCMGILLSAVPAFAQNIQPNSAQQASAESASPAAPPPVTYVVWGFQWDGREYMRQAPQTLNTTNLQKAADYVNVVNGYAGWTAATNLPQASYVHKIFHSPIVTNARPASTPDKPTYAVWAYQLINGQWVKSEQYSWTTQNPRAGLTYAAKVNAVPGWSATTNCPPVVPKAQRYIDGGMVQGAEYYYAQSFGVDLGARTMRIPYLNMTIRLPAGTHWNQGNSGDSDSSGYYDNSADISAAETDWENTQNMLNTQAAINQQNMLDTQNMLNNQQQFQDMENMINTQNQVNNQMQMDAVNAMNAQMNQ
ncbi:MAG TPA: hypothetical protein VMJ32_18535 [Pirellulales bacterium]|nr:hypothetical protein [Pirellulales bacterium]